MVGCPAGELCAAAKALNADHCGTASDVLRTAS